MYDLYQPVTYMNKSVLTYEYTDKIDYTGIPLIRLYSITKNLRLHSLRYNLLVF